MLKQLCDRINDPESHLLFGLQAKVMHDCGVYLEAPTVDVKLFWEKNAQSLPYLIIQQTFPQSQLGVLANNFRNLELELCGNVMAQTPRFLCFSCHWGYAHKDGGSNGTKLCDRDGHGFGLFFDLETEKWLTREEAAKVQDDAEAQGEDYCPDCGAKEGHLEGCGLDNLLDPKFAPKTE